MWIPLLLTLAQAPAPSPNTEGALLAAERAFLAGDWDGTLDHAAAVPADSPLFPRAKALVAMAEAERGALRESARAWTAVARSGDAIHGDLALLSMAGLYTQIERWDNVEVYMKLIPPESPNFAQALAGRASALSRSGARWDLRVEMGLIDSLEGPYLQGEWFAPEIPALHAQRLLELCWLPEGEATLAHAQGRVDALTVLLDDHVNSSDAALWARLQAGDWGDEGLETWISLDPLLARPAALALAHGVRSPEEAARYRQDAVGWLRLRLEEARGRVAEAHASLARAGLLLDGLQGRVPAAEACAALPRFDPDPFAVGRTWGGGSTWGYVKEPERGERWLDEVGTYVFDGESRCEGGDAYEVLGCLK